MGAKQSKYSNGYIIVSPNAGLGNQLFQIANGYALSKRYNKNLLIHSIWNGMSKIRPSYWRSFLKNVNQYLVHPRETKKIEKYKEPTFGYSTLQNFSKSVILEGYYQSELYFEDYKEEIKSLFELTDELKPSFEFIGECKVAIHVRRGDYLKHPDMHITMSKEYYMKAKQIIEEKLGFIPTYYYFSDDIQYTKEMFKNNINNNDKFISGYKDYEELYIMSQCNHFIIANSTFSWWAAYLSSKESEFDKIVICPNPWFGIKGPQDFHSIYCKNWIQLDSNGKNIIPHNLDSNSILINHESGNKNILKISSSMNLNLINSKSSNGILFYNKENDTSLAFSNSGNIYTSKSENIYYDSYNRNSNFSMNKSSIEKIQDEHIQSRLIISDKQDNPFNLYIINLKHRSDRKQEILSALKHTSTFNIHFFEAVKFQKGWIGCGLSHLYLIRYAQIMNLPYIIVAEDDFLFKLSDEKVKEALTLLTSNLDDWEVFNGSPSFWDKRNSLKELDFFEPKSDLKSLFTKVNWGQSTSFMIYNSNSYSKLLKYPFTCEIDQYIAKQFFQIVYKPEPFSIQKASYSDVSNIKQTKNYEKFFIEQHNIVKSSISSSKELTIGIQAIFVDKYETFYEQFISNCEELFLPQYKKFYYIITDNPNLPKYNDRTFIYKTERIGWPYETLYRFKYFLQFKQDEIDKSDYIYFINSNGKFLETISKEVLPNESGYSFTIHHGFNNKKYSDLAYEKNNKSTAYIPFDNSKHYKYFAGGFYGATKDKFIELCQKLDNNISQDEKNNYIAIWHDESHINKFCFDLDYKFKWLDINYHIPEEKIKNFKDKKLIYLDKKRYIPQTNTLKNLKHGNKNTNGTIILNKYNCYFIISN